MARSTEDYLRDALEFHAEHGEQLAAADPAPAVRTVNRWIPVAAFGAVAATVAVVATVALATSGEDRGPATPPGSVSVPSVSAATVEPRVVAIPDLAGLTSDDAQARLAALGLTMERTAAESADADKGRAIAQNPTADTLVEPGSTVTVTFGAGIGLEATAGSSNDSQFVMPDITDLTPQAAAAVLESLGWKGDVTTLTTGAKSTRTTDRSQVGKILTQTPEAGATVPKTVRIGIEIGTA